jgi:hypothetical protein
MSSHARPRLALVSTVLVLALAVLGCAVSTGAVVVTGASSPWLTIGS